VNVSLKHGTCLVLLAIAFASGCATLPKPEALSVVEQQAQLPTTKEAALLAPQAFAHAKQLQQRAEQALEDGDRESAEILAEHALAAYQRALVAARLVRAQQRIDTSQAALDSAETELTRLTQAQQETEAAAKTLELRARVIRDAEALVAVEKASPEREAARQVAASSIVEAARLLCLSARMLDPNADKGGKLSAELDALESRLRNRETPTPIAQAMTLRAECLRTLTLTRRAANQTAPETDPADVLLVQLEKALPAQRSIRDDRGVVLIDGAVFDARSKTLTEAGKQRVQQVAEIARANPSFPLLVVVHGPESLGREQQAALEQALAQHSVKGSVVRAAGTRLPATVAPVKGAPSGEQRVEFIWVAPQ
jgi:hypothetical protein